MKKYVRLKNKIIQSEDYAPALFVLAHKEEFLYVCEDVFGWANITQGSADRFSYKSIGSPDLIEDLKWNGIDLEDVCIMLPDGNTMDFLTKDMEVLKQFKDNNYVREADTIEDLIDVIVIVDRSGYTKVFECQTEEQKKLINDVINLWGVQAVYASIWVRDIWNKPTLEPVAKMNKEGELELL